MQCAEVFLDQRVDQHRDQQHQNQRPHRLPGHQADGGRAQERERKRRGGGIQHRPPRKAHRARVSPRRRSGAEHCAELVGAENQRRRLLRQRRKQPRQLDQSATADRRIHQPGHERNAQQPRQFGGNQFQQDHAPRNGGDSIAAAPASRFATQSPIPNPQSPIPSRTIPACRPHPPTPVPAAARPITHVVAAHITPVPPRPTPRR